jgi:hypothetical protein
MTSRRSADLEEVADSEGVRPKADFKSVRPPVSGCPQINAGSQIGTGSLRFQVSPGGFNAAGVGYGGFEAASKAASLDR